MRVPVIQRYLSIEHDNPIDKWIPEDPRRVVVHIDVFIGPDEKPSGEYFTVCVVTKDLIDEGMDIGKWECVLDEYSWNSFTKWVREVVMKCKGDNWTEMANQLREYMHWEFEGYRDSNINA